MQKLEHGDMWAIAIENAVGRVLNAFIVTDHKDALILRACAREANYNHLQIIIYDFSRPRLLLVYVVESIPDYFCSEPVLRVELCLLVELTFQGTCFPRLIIPLHSLSCILTILRC